MSKRLVAIAGCLLVALASNARAAGPSPVELARSARWATAKFAGVAAPAPAEPGLIVRANNDPVQRNSRGGQPMRMGGGGVQETWIVNSG